METETNMRTFQGVLDHKNPRCESCSKHCFSLYRGGKKDRVEQIYFCKNCSIIYQLPNQKKCKFTEVIA